MHFRNLSTCFKPAWLSERRFCISNPFCEWAPLVFRAPPRHPKVPRKLAVKHTQDPQNCICVLRRDLRDLPGTPSRRPSAQLWGATWILWLLSPGQIPRPVLALCHAWLRGGVAAPGLVVTGVVSVPSQTGRCCKWEQVVCASLLLTPDQSAPKPVPSRTGLQPSPGPGYRWCSPLPAYLEMLGSACAPGRTLYPGSPENYCPEKEPQPSGPRVGCTTLLNKMFCV